MDALKPYQLKKSAAEKFVLMGGPIIIFGVLIIIGLGTQNTLFILGISVIAIGAILILVGSFRYTNVVKGFKKDYLPTVIKDWIDEGEYRHDFGLDQGIVYACEFLPGADRFFSEDYVKGYIEGVPFQMSDVKLQRRHTTQTKNGTQTYYVDYFVGQYYVLDFNKNFEGAVQVLESHRPESNRPFKKVKLESVAFNKTFKTYATGDHTAFYLLTPQMMERMMELEKTHSGQLGFSFIDNKMFIAIHNNHSILEVRMFRKLDDSLIESFKNDFRLLDDLVKELKLNKKIYKEI